MKNNKGIIAINKPEGWTSFDVVNKLKYLFKPLKVGHLGTLDPMATGVLLVTLGKATKLFDLMQEKQKTYIATFKFGTLTNTLDSTGEVIEVCNKIPFNKTEIIAVLPMFIGEISQIPPKYSAKSVNGKRAYDLARQGIDFELKPKNVKVYDIKILDFDGFSVKLEITCGSGTYIRSLGRDIAQKLGTFATMTSLVRTKIDDFNLEKCLNIQDVVNNPEQSIISIDKVLNYPILKVDDAIKNKLLNGQKLEIKTNEGIYLLKDNNDIVALIEIKENLAKMFVFLG